MRKAYHGDWRAEEGIACVFMVRVAPFEEYGVPAVSPLPSTLEVLNSWVSRGELIWVESRVESESLCLYWKHSGTFSLAQTNSPTMPLPPISFAFSTRRCFSIERDRRRRPHT